MDSDETSGFSKGWAGDSLWDCACLRSESLFLVRVLLGNDGELASAAKRSIVASAGM
jgi:hypothetical protein